MECEFLGTNSYELDGYIKGFNSHKIQIKIPSGYIATREVGNYTTSFQPNYTNVFKTAGEIVEQGFSTNNLYANLKIASGITNDNEVINYGCKEKL